MIYRTAASEGDVERAIQIYRVDEPSLDVAKIAAELAHWQWMRDSSPECFWIAEDEATGQIVGVASAVRRPPQWALANFYVLDAYKGQGIGKELMTRAYAAHQDCDRFLVHASEHPSAQRLYMQFGMYPLPYSIYFKGSVEGIVPPQALTVEECSVEAILPAINDLDQQALGFTRAQDHRWWAGFGSYFLLRNQNQPVGYFRAAPEGKIGPLVVSNERWMADALDCAILSQRDINAEPHEIFVPGANRSAIAHLLERGYRYAELNLLLSSHPMPGLALVTFHDTDLL